MYAAAHVKRLVNDTYFNGNPLRESDYLKGRQLFVLEGCCANGIVALTTGAFLSGYASSLGADDSQNGLIGSIPTLLCTAQLFSSIVFGCLKQKKLLISSFALLHRLLLTSIFFIPLVVKGWETRLLAMIIIYAIAHCFGAFIGTGAGNWMLTLVPANKLGHFLGAKDAWAFSLTTLLSLVLGRCLDWFRAERTEQAGFYMIGLVVLAFTFIDFYCFSSIKEPVAPTPRYRIKLMDVIREPLADRSFRKIMLFYVLWNLALQVAGPFFSVYMVTGLKLDYTYITALGLIASATRIGAAYVWGRLADVKSWLWVTKFSMLLLSITHFSWFFMTKQTCIVMQPVLQATSGIAWGGIAIAVFNLQYQYAPEDKRVLYVSANSSLAGLCGFLATLLGAFLLKLLPNFRFLGLPITGMQVLFAVSGVSIGLCVLYIMKRLSAETVPNPTE